MVISIKNRGKLSYTTILIFKIIQIPALILTAITTLLFLAGSFNPFLMVFIPSIIYNGYMYCFILILSSNLHTIFRLTENRNKDHSKYYIIHVIMQFIFLLDYIDTLYLAIKELYNKKIEKKWYFFSIFLYLNLKNTGLARG